MERVVLGTAYGLGLAVLRKTPAPPEIVLALGGAAETSVIFFLLLAGAGRWYVFLALGAVAIACWRMFPRSPLDEAVKRPLGKGGIAAAGFSAPMGIWYFVNALAPETQADGMSYHLGLPYEYVRLGGFLRRITFYDLMPQGMEMLYTVAFVFGRHSAAKLVGFVFSCHPAAVFPHCTAARIGRDGRPAGRGVLLLCSGCRRDGRLVL